MILLRHGQTVFNLHFGRRRVDPGVPDPGLTELGQRQATAAARELAETPIRRIVASPYRRALETAAIVARTVGCGVEVDADVRERAGYSCDIGSPLATLEADWPHLDFGDLADDWWAYRHGDPQMRGLDESEAALNRRIARFRERAAARADWRETLVVCHWGSIRAMHGETVANGQYVRHDPTCRARVPPRSDHT